MSELTDEVLSTSDVYFKCAKECIHFLYLDLDLFPMGFIKVFLGGKLVDEDVVAALKLRNLARFVISHCGLKESDESIDH